MKNKIADLLFLIWPLMSIIGILSVTVIPLYLFFIFLSMAIFLFFVAQNQIYIIWRCALAFLFFSIGGVSAYLNNNDIQQINQSASYNFQYIQLRQIEPVSATKNRLLFKTDNNSFIQITSSYSSPAICSLNNIHAFLNKPLKAQVPNGFNLSQYAKNKHIIGYGWALTAPQNTGLMQADYACRINLLRQKIYRHLQQYFSESNLNLAATLLLGYRAALDDDIKSRFQHLGISHILAISGLHIGLVTLFFFGFFRFTLSLIPKVNLHYNIKSIAALFTIPIVIFYCIIAGAEASTLRATIMMVYGLWAIILLRPPLSFRVYSFALLTIILLWPMQIYSSGFQLSFLAVFGLILFSKVIWVKNRFYQSLLSTFFIVIWLMPISLYYFGFVSVLSVVANLLIIPFLSFIILPSLFLGFLFPPIWKISNIAIDFLLNITQKHDIPIIIVTSVKPDIAILVITYLLLTATFVVIFIYNQKIKYWASFALFFLANIMFFSHLHYKTSLINQDMLVYEGPIWVWKQQNKVYIQSLNTDIKLKPYLQKQVSQYYGIPIHIKPVYRYQNTISLNQTHIAYTPFVTDIPAFCKNYTLIFAPYNGRCLNENGLYLRQPFKHDYYRIRHIFDKDKLRIEHFIP